MKKTELVHSAKNVWKAKKKNNFQGDQKKQIEKKLSDSVNREIEESEFSEDLKKLGVKFNF